MRLFAVLLLLFASGCERASERGPLVVVALFDGLSPRAVTSERMPALAGLAASEGATFWAEAQSVMPSVTNTNHTSVVTGAYAEAHGITGNYFWDGSGSPGQGLDDPRFLEAATVFTLAGQSPKLVTAGAFGKPKLGRLFSAGNGQRAPDAMWSRGADERTMSEALRMLETAAPDFLFVALADVDLRSHAFGPDSDEAREATTTADRQIARLVGHLRDSGRWEQTVLFVTADHSFTSLVPGEENPRPMISLGRELERAGLGAGFVVVSDGSLAHVYRRSATDGEGGDLRRAAGILLAVPGVAAVLARDGAAGLPAVAAEHPDWHLDHPRAGDLVVLAKPGHHFNDPFQARLADLLGQHGGVAERPIPLLVAGGHRVLRPGVRRVDGPADNADVGATVLALLGHDPRRIDGRAIAEASRGRVLREAFVDGPLAAAFGGAAPGEPRSAGSAPRPTP